MSTTVDQLRAMALGMPGKKMPAERELAARFGVGRKQVRAALAALAVDGLVVRRQGSGTYVSDTLPANAKSMTVALLVDAALRLGDDPFFSLLVDMLQRAMQSAGMPCLVQRVDAGSPSLPRVDGIVTTGLAGISVVEALTPDSPPAVCLFLPDTAFRVDRRVSFVAIDDRLAGARAAERLIEHGCGSLIFAGMNDLPMSRQRLAGVNRVAQDAGVPFRAIRSGSNFQYGLLFARSLAGDPEHLTGIVAANDWMAVGIQTGLMSRGLAVDHYRVVGFDGLDIAADPALAIESIMFPLDAIVDDAVAELLRLSASPSIPGRIVRYAPMWRS